MFKELTDELLELTATQQGYRKAYLAQSSGGRGGSLCCSCSCCCHVVQ